MEGRLSRLVGDGRHEAAQKADAVTLCDQGKGWRQKTSSNTP